MTDLPQSNDDGSRDVFPPPPPPPEPIFVKRTLASLIPPLPAIFYMPDKFRKGADSFSDVVDPLVCGEFLSVFESHHITDAHFVTYQATGPDNHQIPRLNKPILPRVRVSGEDIVSTMLVLDWDTPGHVPLTRALFDEFFTKLVTAGMDWSPAVAWTLLYSTRNGCRLVYVLDKPLPVDEAEGRHRGLCLEFVKRGIAIDTTVSDWTRVFRLPHVMRDKKPTWEDQPHEFLLYKENRFDGQIIPPAKPLKKTNQYDEIRVFSDPKPDEDTCKALLFTTNLAGRPVFTDFFTNAKNRLRGRECYPCIFEMASLAAPGTRDDTIMRFVGEAIGLLYTLDGCRPEHIYALFLDAVLQLEPDAKTKSWTDVLWSSVGRTWVKEEAQHKAEERKAEEVSSRITNLAESVVKGMAKWCKHPDLQDNHKAVPYVSRHLIALHAHTCYILSPRGTYDPTGIPDKQIISAIRTRGMDALVDTRVRDEKGKLGDKSIQHFLNDYSTIVSETIGVPGEDGAVIENLDTPAARLILPAFWRNTDLRPAYDTDVDSWLQKLGGKEYPLLIRWIAWAIAFDEGCICALSIAGKAGSGKKMLVQGLAETLRVPKVATSGDLVGTYNYGLLESPYLSIDEGWVQPGKGRHPADQFRSLVAGDGVEVNRRYMPPVRMMNPLRVIFTANNLEAVRVLTHRRELSSADREALAVRLFHINITDDAAVYLDSMGGHQFTAKHGRRWIRGDSGEVSDYVVARHFLYLYEKRHELGPKGKRFLVEGNASSEILFELRTQTGSSPMVIETLIKMLEKRQTREWDGLVVSENRLYASAAEVLEYYRNNLQDKAKDTMTADQILGVFKGLAVQGEATAPYVLKEREGMGPRRWTEIDTRLLLKVAQKDGWPCKTLMEMVAATGGVGVEGETVAKPIFENSEREIGVPVRGRIQRLFGKGVDMGGV